MELFDRSLKHNGLASVRNVRIRGKIRHEEWPKIAARYQSGESLTDIARSYRCTAPAIRYIVKRVSSRPVKGRTLAGNLAAMSKRVSPSVLATARPNSGSASELQRSDLWDTINRDLATYLTVMDSLAVEESDGNYEALLTATDQVLRATARTRLALERIVASRKKFAQTRRLVSRSFKSQ